MQQPQIEDVDIEISEPQAAVMATRQGVILNMSGQGGGKSQVIGYVSGQFVIDLPQIKQFIGANTYLQLSQSTLTRVFDVWKRVYDLVEYDPKGNPGGAFVVDKKPPMHFDKFHSFKEYNNIISFWNGAIIFTGSLDNYKAHEGKEFGIAHLDETKDTKENALKEVIFGRLRQYGLWYDRDGAFFFCDTVTTELEKVQGWKAGARLTPEMAAALGWTSWNPLYVHTSPALGGTDWLNELFKLDSFADDIKEKVMQEDRDFFYKEFSNKAICIYSVHHNNFNPPGFIASQIASQTEEGILRVVYAYPFAKTGGEYFPHFNRKKHVRPVTFVQSIPVCQSWDFNVVPYMTCLCGQIRYATRYLDDVGQKHETPAVGYKPLNVMVIGIYKEYCLESPHNSTDSVCDHFMNDHDPRLTEVNYYGDCHGLHRIPGLGNVTNFKMIEDKIYVYLHNFSKKVKDPNVGPAHRRDLINKILEGKIPTVEIEIDPSCVKTIKDMEKVKLGKNGKIKEEAEDPNTKKKYQVVGHTSDALEYLVSEVCKEFLD